MLNVVWEGRGRELFLRIFQIRFPFNFLFFLRLILTPLPFWMLSLKCIQLSLQLNLVIMMILCPFAFRSVLSPLSCSAQYVPQGSASRKCISWAPLPAEVQWVPPVGGGTCEKLQVAEERKKPGSSFPHLSSSDDCLWWWVCLFCGYISDEKPLPPVVPSSLCIQLL